MLILAVGTLQGSPAAALPPAATADAWFDGAPAASDLAALGDMLVDGEASRRAAAFDRLSHLPATAVDAIRERFEALGKARLPSEKIVAALTSFRRSTGSTRADDDVDLAPGILVTTATERTDVIARTAEVVLLLRSLEALDTPAAALLIAEGIAVDPAAFSQEAVRIRNRLGDRLLPAMVELRGHRTPEIRRWASRGLRALGATDPTVATQQADPERLAALLGAYGRTHDLEALGVLVSFLNDSRIQVRSAARSAVRAMGRNAIWKLRTAFQEVTGKSANPQWDTDETLDELCLLFDRHRIERAETALSLGLNAHLAGDLLKMVDQFDAALRVDPQLARQAEMAPGFAALGAARFAQDDLVGAVTAYRRAVRLAPAHADAASWRAEITYIAAERALTRGVVDIPGYETTLSLKADHSGAAAAIDRLSGAWSARTERTRRLTALAAILLLCAFGVGVLRVRRAAAPTASENDLAPLA